LLASATDELVMVEICFSTARHYIPPLLIFPTVRMEDKFPDGAPPVSIAVCHLSGKQIHLYNGCSISFTTPNLQRMLQLLLLDVHAP